ncbi:hypothetical protein OC846_001902 [Tilletia horrida]|uniref:Protein kinase domain-containing protein n=1 Tax=Tilletia horrida TaxID=155126 RepID=A0AAN6GUK1_9BASI|nr:hypothetical protein OC846_001902 [Tilletia horrida]KAK0568337.1 hypothetical protein OC861_002048 [Tilletia horrida]
MSPQHPGPPIGMSSTTQTTIKWVTRVPFGSLPVHPSALHPVTIEQSFIITWAISRSKKGMRLSLAHQGMLFHIVIPSTTVLGKALFESVQDCWFEKARKAQLGLRDWSGRPRVGVSFFLKELQAAAPVEDALLSKVEVALEDLLVQATQGSKPFSSGQQLWLEAIWSQPDNPDSALRLEVVGDVFRDLIPNRLHSLTDTDWATVPRIDLSSVKGYFLQQGYYKDDILPVYVSIDGEVRQAMLKTRSFGPDVGSGPVALDRNAMFTMEIFRGELDLLCNLPPHPNVLGAPLALVTVTVQEPEGNTNSDDPPRDSLKLVGWLHPFLRTVTEKRPFFSWTEEGVRHSIRHVLDLFRGLQHLFQQGFVHPDIKAANCLFDGRDSPDGVERLVVIDLQPRKKYECDDGPHAPEVQGHWDAAPGEDGTVVYTYKDKAEYCGNKILTAWKSMPEALERIIVYNAGVVASRLIVFRLMFPWLPEGSEVSFTRLVVREPPQPGANAELDASEALIPPQIREVIQRCVSYDPRDRPLMTEVIHVLEDVVASQEVARKAALSEHV